MKNISTPAPQPFTAVDSPLAASTEGESTQGAAASTKILIADDSPTDLLLLQTILRQHGHEVVVAINGREAVELFRRERPGIVLLDALMPVMDGFEAAREIKLLAGEEFVPVIFLTSLQEADSLARCLDAGGDDFLSKPYRGVILKAKINAFVRMRMMHRTLQQQRDEIAAHNHHLLREQEIAKRVFDKVAHAGCLDASNIRYSLSPIAVFNGDVALAGVSPDGSLVVLLGDFTGHGLDAAIGAMPLAQTFYSMLEKGFSARDILREINLKLHDILPVGVFCCALVADIDFQHGVMRVWNGGLPDCVLYRAETGAVVRLPSSHVPLGILPNRSFRNTPETYEVKVGDRLYLWSDGIHEALNDQGDMFGEQRLLEVFANNKDPECLFGEVNVAIKSFIGEGTPSDDISMVEVKVVAFEDFAVATPQSSRDQQVGPKDWSLRYVLRPETLKDFDPLPLMLHILMQVPFLRPHSNEIYTVMTELYTNALDHGVLALSSSLKNSPDGFGTYYQLRGAGLEALSEGEVTIDLHYSGDTRGGQLTLIFEDSGAGFDYSNILVEVDNQSYSGRGIRLISSICDSITYCGVGNQVRALFTWGECRAARSTKGINSSNLVTT